MDEIKICALCKIPKSVDEFWKNPRTRDGLRTHCKKCASDLNRKRDFGVSPMQLAFLFELQGNRCAVCGEPLGEGKDVHVDHDHRTNEVRGLLCGQCNKGLGHMRDDVEIMRKAIEYLSKPAPSLPQRVETCEICKKEHDGSYGSGRFCSQRCARIPSSKNLILFQPGVRPAANTIAAVIESNKRRKNPSRPAWNKGIKGSTWKKRRLQEPLVDSAQT